MRQKYFVALALLLFMVFTGTASWGESRAVPAGISMKELFFSWLKCCYNEKNLEKIVDTPDNIEKYTAIVQKSLKKINTVYLQDKQATIDGVQLPYLYIDEKYKFARYIGSYSDKELHIALEGGDDFQPLHAIDTTLGSYYLQLLPYKNGEQNEYILLVFIRAVEGGEYYGDRWFFKVRIHTTATKQNSIFTVIDSNNRNDIPCEYENAMIDTYSTTSFFNTPYYKDAGHIECDKQEHNPVYDYDKKSGELFIYDFDNPVFGLRFIWNGKRFIKKDIRKRDMLDAIIARRGEE